MSQANDAVQALKVIRRVVDDTLTRIGRQTPDDDPMGYAPRAKAAAAEARAIADDLRDLGDLVALHRFCCEQIDSWEQLWITVGIDGALALSTLQEIQSVLTNAGTEPRTENPREDARGTELQVGLPQPGPTPRTPAKARIDGVAKEDAWPALSLDVLEALKQAGNEVLAHKYVAAFNRGATTIRVVADLQERSEVTEAAVQAVFDAKDTFVRIHAEVTAWLARQQQEN